jgi:hypothetical protein
MGAGEVLEADFWKVLGTYPQLGLLRTISALRMDDSAPFTWSIFALNLLGDPSMSIWRGTPKRFVVTHPATTFLRTFTVKVALADGTSFYSAPICVTGPRSFFEVKTAHDGDVISFSATGIKVGETLTVTVSGLDTVPYEGTVEFVAVPRERLRRANVNLDDKVDISDAIALLGSLFLGTRELDCPGAADANGDGRVDISDAVRILGFLFLGERLALGDPDC